MGFPRIVRGALIVAMLGGVPGLVAHGDPPVPPVPKAPAGASASADAALAAFQKGDAKALEEVSKGMSDPWFVAERLLERGELEAAAAFASVAPRPETAALPAYVAKHVVGERDLALREVFKGGTKAHKEERFQDAIEAYDLVLAEARGVLRVQAFHQRALARGHLKQTRESAEDFGRGAAEAEAIGWIARASALLDGAGMDWLELGEDRLALEAFEKEVALDEQRQAGGQLAISLAHLATACFRLGPAQARPHLLK